MPTFIHAADIHLDSPLQGLARYPDAPADTLRNATRLAFQNLIQTAIDRRVDFMVFAGDLYDGDLKDFQTAHFFAREMGRLERAGIDAYVLYGNHDAEAGNQKSIPWPTNTHIFAADRAQTFIREDGIALHGQSYPQRDVTHDMSAAYPAPTAGAFNIGVLHTALDTGGTGEHADYAAVSVDALRAKGYDYWALGHVHTDRVASEQPHIVFPGNLQGRHIKETGAKSARLVQVEGGRITRFEKIHCDVLRWERVEVDVSGCPDTQTAAAAARDAVSARMGASDRPIATRIVFVGETEIHGQLLAASALGLRQDVIGALLALDPSRLWVEKVVVQTSAPARGFYDHRVSSVEGFEAMLHAAAADADLAAEISDDLTRVMAKAGLPTHEQGDLAQWLSSTGEMLEQEANALLGQIESGTSE